MGGRFGKYGDTKRRQLIRKCGLSRREIHRIEHPCSEKQLPRERTSILTEDEPKKRRKKGEKKMGKEVKRISKEKLLERLEEPGVRVIDVRVNWESSPLKIRHAVRENPLGNVLEWAGKYGKSDTIILYCSTPEEKTSEEIALAMVEEGFSDVSILRGGWTLWESSRFPVEKTGKDPLPKGVVADVMGD